jgi:hypothetical protein
MWPWAAPGDYLLLVRCRARHIRRGTVVVFRHRDLGILVKRIAGVAADQQVVVKGDAAASSSPQAIGAIAREQIIGRVWLRVRGRATP